MNQRRLQALRNLAERPGTEAEGVAARERLAKAGAATPELPKSTIIMGWGQWHTCACGHVYPPGSACPNATKHAAIQADIRLRFPRGTRIYYNRWAYSANAQGVVTGYPHEWDWLRIKFDHLKAPRSVPILSAKGCHISTEPVDQETLDQTGLGGFTAAEKREMSDVIDMIRKNNS